MEDNQFSKRTVIFGLLFSIGVVLIIFISSKNQSKTRIVFCDVGQGDAAYIRTSENIDILIDAGPSKQILDCLGKYLPFFDKTIELVLISHPQKDHYGGLQFILDRYNLAKIVTIPVDNKGSIFDSLKKKIREKQIPVINAYSGDKIRLGQKDFIIFLWPNRQFLAENSSKLANTSNSQVLGAYEPTIDLNNFSQIFLFKEGQTDILFTGDIDIEEIDHYGFGPYFQSELKRDLSGGLEILKVPHHGSKHGLNYDFLKLADPSLSVISVGKINSYGHPSKEVLDMYKASEKKYLMTKDQGDVVIEIDEKGYSVRKGQQSILLHSSDNKY